MPKREVAIMNSKKVVYQRPCPIITIKDPDTGKEKITFSVAKNTNLLSYQYSLSVNDISGSFSITFYPEYKDSLNKSHSLFDDINKLDIVEIYENIAGNSDKPTFTGIVKTKKYVAQANDQGGIRRLSISGCSIAGLVSQFYINLDVTAQALTDQLVEDKSISNKLTYDLASETTIKNVVLKIWESFLNIAEQNGTPKIAEYIERFMGGTDEFFDVDESLTLKYPLGCVFAGQQTQDFYSIIDGIIPPPYYEKFAYTDSSTGKMKIKIRKVPFSSDDWAKSTTYILTALDVKAFDLSESDSEVYTTFYAYLNGSALDERKALILSTEELQKDTTLNWNPDKYKIYGYRPLIIHFLGYGLKDGADDSSLMSEATEDLIDMYKNVDEMLKGSITLAMANDNELIQPGECVSFLGGQFYVEGISHSWNYGAGGEVNLSVSRGGSYSLGEYKGTIKDLSKNITLLESGGDLYSV